MGSDMDAYNSKLDNMTTTELIQELGKVVDEYKQSKFFQDMQEWKTQWHKVNQEEDQWSR